ncbi:MAG: hypothetical protein ACR5LA_06075 [Wolbachia sp.]
MPNISEVNRELVKAFNINLRFNGIAVTNLTVQNLHGKDHIVISFDNNMGSKQCMDYLNDLKEKIIKKSYKNKEAAGVSYNLKFFPFAFNMKHLPRDNKGRKKFSVEIDKEVVFNLKCYLAQALVGDVIEKMGSKFGVERIKKSIYDTNFDRDSYLYCMLFRDEGLQKDFVDSFSAEIEDYPNPPSSYLEVNGNLVYIRKSIFDNVEFIKDIIAYNTSLECRYLQTPSAKNKTVDKLKYTMIDLIERAAGIPVRTITRTSYVDKKEDSVLIPLVQNGKFLVFLNKEDAYNLNRTFGDAVVTRIESRRLKNPYWDSDYVYAIDFADVDIACCIMDKIMESSVISEVHAKDYELSIDPQSQVGMPNGYLSKARVESPTRKSDGVLKDSPRQWSEKGELLSDYVDLAGTSGWPSTQGPFKPVGNLSAAENVQVEPSAWAQQPNPWSSQSTFGNQCTLPTVPGGWPQSGPSSFKSMPAAQLQGRCSLPVFYAQSSDISVPRFQLSTQLSSSRSSLWKDAAKNVQALTGAWDQPIYAWPSPAPSAGFSLWPPSRPSSSKSANEWRTVDKPLTEEEEKLIKKLLDMFNFNHYIGGVHTNFTLENGKIVGFLYVDKREYLQKVRNYIIKKHCGTEEEARKVYDFGQFPFVFPPDSNYEEDEGVTDIAYNVRGAVFNLKIHLIQEFKRDVEDEVIKKLEEEMKMTKEEVCECIRKSVHLEKVNNPTSYLCDISFSNEYFQNQPELSNELEVDVETLFKEFKNIYVEEFKSRLKKCNLDVSLVSHDGNVLHIKSAIDTQVVKEVKKCAREETPVKQFPRKEVIIEIPIVLQDGLYTLDTSDIPSETRLLRQRARPTEGGMLGKNISGKDIGKKPQKCKSSLSKEEQELFKALLYAFNLNNHILECHHTNFIVENEKIVSSLHDSVNVKEYLHEVIDKTKEEYRVNKKEAYDLNEFPFKFLSNCEKNQETTVVANISSGAFCNLKKLFIQEHKKKVKIENIDIKIVEKYVESKRRELVNSDVKKIEEERGNRLTPEELVKTCYPDESALEDIPISKYEVGYCLDRGFHNWETKSLMKRCCAKGTSVAGKGKPEDDKDSGISSGEATDAENVSSKAEATTSSGHESMDCENPPTSDQKNTGGGSPKRKSPSPEDGGSPRKSPKRDSPPLSRLESLSLSSSSHQIG